MTDLKNTEDPANEVGSNRLVRRPPRLLGASLEAVLAERERQDSRWGVQNHDPFAWITILMEEVGETAQCALCARFGGKKAAELRREAVQVAAVALAFVECLDRGEWAFPASSSDPVMNQDGSFKTNASGEQQPGDSTK